MDLEQLKKKIDSTVRAIPDFPKPGIIFRDVTTLLLDHEAFNETNKHLTEKFKDSKIDYVAGIESRGFIFGAPLALSLGVGFVVLRKPNKLPGEVESVSYNLEYGSDTLNVHKGAIPAGSRVLIVDDLMATGGTMHASCQLIEKVGGEVVSCVCVIELPDLKGREKLAGKDVYTIIQYLGD
eukprot:GFYU01007860.1.p1 GENE.GFYU01007860.1~~GFYU01007860.1.p1  ORF type:complete len:181 (-),score=75.23 GFYU01007860.1:128-670(-)